MQEAVLHHIWKFKAFTFLEANTQQGESLKLIKVGQHNTTQSGPDFFNAKLEINGQLWAGNVEIHIKSSDWYAHNHETDSAYDNVILHVVWEHDAEVFRHDESVIPTLELKKLVSKTLIKKSEDLLEHSKAKWINCEGDFHNFNDFLVENWLERLYLERLEDKSIVVLQLLKDSNNDWEAVLFQLLAKNFGLNVNGDFFLRLAKQIPFSVIRKTSSRENQLEALFFGLGNLLQGVDEVPYAQKLQKEFDYLKHKFKLDNTVSEKPQFFRLRPDNFPTIRLAQLAELYLRRQSLFSEVIKASSVKDIQKLFTINLNEFWQSHYSLSKSHKSKPKSLSKSFINLLIINTVAPLLFCYSKSVGQSNAFILEWLRQLPKETNRIIENYNQLRPKTAGNALDSQALIQMKKYYCTPNQCLKCQLGISLLRNDAVKN